MIPSKTGLKLNILTVVNKKEPTNFPLTALNQRKNGMTKHFVAFISIVSFYSGWILDKTKHLYCFYQSPLSEYYFSRS